LQNAPELTLHFCNVLFKPCHGASVNPFAASSFLFPPFAKNLWGVKHFGMNYGVLFSAWGVGVFALVRVSEMLRVKTGGFTVSLAAAGALLVVGAMLAGTLKTRKAEVPAFEGAFEEEEDLVLSKATND
jgi:hypothetical protein